MGGDIRVLGTTFRRLLSDPRGPRHSWGTLTRRNWTAMSKLPRADRCMAQPCFCLLRWDIKDFAGSSAHERVKQDVHSGGEQNRPLTATEMILEQWLHWTKERRLSSDTRYTLWRLYLRAWCWKAVMACESHGLWHPAQLCRVTCSAQRAQGSSEPYISGRWATNWGGFRGEGQVWWRVSEQPHHLETCPRDQGSGYWGDGK